MKTHKTCFKCRRRKPLGSFYRHPFMADGHLNKCKTCARRDVSLNYAARRDQYRAYDRERNSRPERKAAARHHHAMRRVLYPGKARANDMVSNALCSGRLVREPCVHCGATVNIEAHHRDYRKPLDVVWVCRKCHREIEHGIVAGKKYGATRSQKADTQ